jgi:uncharacterized metal-binding protein
MLWNYSNYGNDLQMLLCDAQSCYHSGECTNDVLELCEVQYIKDQLDSISPDNLREELREYGTWDDDELINHQSNLHRWVWISAGDIVEQSNELNYEE